MIDLNRETSDWINSLTQDEYAKITLQVDAGVSMGTWENRADGYNECRLVIKGFEKFVEDNAKCSGLNMVSFKRIILDGERGFEVYWEDNRGAWSEFWNKEHIKELNNASR